MATLRVLQAGDDRGREMSLIEHLEDLRQALIVSLLAWGAASVGAFFFWKRAVDFLVQRGGLQHTYFTTPSGAFLLGVRLAVTMGLVAAFPVIAQRAWWFISPGLRREERRLALPLFLATVFFFTLGLAVALFSLPLFVHILTGFAPADLNYLPLIDDYLGFTLLLTVGFGLVFELPVVLYVLGRLGIVSSRWLYRHRVAWILGLAVLANFLTPGADPITPLLMFVPLYVFWEGTALLLKLTGR
ncbi:MAG TPA: twin-arginine translocase subunit TatC [Candidatus Dormibacteraeota bacterium]